MNAEMCSQHQNSTPPLNKGLDTSPYHWQHSLTIVLDSLRLKPAESGQKRDAHMLRPLGRLLGDVLAHLPAVLVLVAICVIAHGRETYAKLEGFSVMLVGAIAPLEELPNEIKGTVAITAEPEFFSKVYDGQLPLNRLKTAEILTTLAGGVPRLIALDVDVAPTGEAVATKETDELIKAIRGALNKGINVVAVTYPQTHEDRKKVRDGGVRRLCAELHGSPAKSGDTLPNERPPGRFFLASPILTPEEPFDIVFRVVKHKAHEHHDDQRLFAVIGAVLAGQTDAGLCKGGKIADADLLKIDNVERKWPDLEHMHRIRFTGGEGVPPVVRIPVSSPEKLNQFVKKIHGSTVLFGVRSFDRLDEFLTPAGRIPGVQLQAHIANSWAEGMKQNFVLAAALDIGIGLAFVLVYMLMHSGFKCIDQLNATHLSSLLRLLLPLAVFGAFLCAVLWLSSWQFGKGQWLDPLPMIAGLALHLYAESSEHGHHGHPTLRGWFIDTASAWRNSFKWDGWFKSWDNHVLSLTRSAMIALVVWGSYLVVHHQLSQA